MLTRLRVQNFKNFDDVDIELGQTVVFIGPNNSGKTTALQALWLWYTALNYWSIEIKGWPENVPLSDDLHAISYGERGASINRLDLTSIPIPSADLLWNDRHFQNSDEVLIQIDVTGIDQSNEWKCAFDFRYANDESIYCIPTRITKNQPPFPKELDTLKIAFLPPMSGLVSTEDRLERGSINRRIGEGRTAEVLRNLCFQVYENGHWDDLSGHIKDLFNIELLPPQYLASRGEIRMAYREASGIILDLSASGRGMLQVLLLLAYMYVNPGAVLLLDEPDAHLEIIRQRKIYALIKQVAQLQHSQIIAASHSEVVLEEAAAQDVVITFVRKPHRMNNPRQLAKSLKDIRFVDFYQADQKGWVLYLEDATDLAILITFAEQLDHKAQSLLKDAYVCYLKGDKTKNAREHFYGLREALPDLKGIVIVDQSGHIGKGSPSFTETKWHKCEIENYLCIPDALLEYARNDGASETMGNRVATMQSSIERISQALTTLNKPAPWSDDIKASEDFLAPLFQHYYQQLNLTNLMEKKNFHVLAQYVPEDKIDPEIVEKLDAIADVANQAVTGADLQDEDKD